MAAQPNPDKDNIHAMVDMKVQSASAKVAEQLKRAIVNDVYPVDSRLPSERMLASEFGVARNTIREALDAIEDEGLIRRRAGAGSFVNRPSNLNASPSAFPSIADDASPLDILVVRAILEPEIVRLAVVNMTPRQFEQLDKIVSNIESVRTDYNEFDRYEEDFYRQIAAGSGNPVLEACYNVALQASKQNFREALLRRNLTPNRIRSSQSRYNVLFNAILSRDAEAAVELIKLHLVEEQRMLSQPDAGVE